MEKNQDLYFCGMMEVERHKKNIKDLELYLIKRQKYRRMCVKKFYEQYSLELLKAPRIWTKIRKNYWWEQTVMTEFTDSDWIQNFRVNKVTFAEICSMVHSDLRPQPTFIYSREPLSVEKQVGIALYKLASCSELRVIANSMNVVISTVHKCIRRFVEAMLKYLTETIYLPTADEAIKISSCFEEISKIPQILLIVDGTHIPILAPKQGYGDFVNRKGWTSYNVQLACDSNYRFRDVSCQYPGATHDALVFKNSGLFQNAKELLPKNPKQVEGYSVDYFVLGDPAYPLLNWLIKGYSGKLTAEEESFNAYMNSARIMIEQLIGKLKSRWRILKKQIELDYVFVPKLIVVCCMLHNIVEKNKVPLPSDDMTSNNLIQPDIKNMNIMSNNKEGEILRNVLKSVTNKYPLRQQIHLKNN